MADSVDPPKAEGMLKQESADDPNPAPPVAPRAKIPMKIAVKVPVMVGKLPAKLSVQPARAAAPRPALVASAPPSKPVAVALKPKSNRFDDDDDDETAMMLGSVAHKKAHTEVASAPLAHPKPKAIAKPQQQPPPRKRPRSPPPPSSSSSTSTPPRSPSTSSAEVGDEDDVTLFQFAKSLGAFSDVPDEKKKSDADDEEKKMKEEEERLKNRIPVRPPLAKFFSASALGNVKQKVGGTLNRFRALATIQDDSKTVSLSTSKVNYIDPRITCAWAKKERVPITSLFSKTLREKFPWAVGVDPDFRF